MFNFIHFEILNQVKIISLQLYPIKNQRNLMQSQMQLPRRNHLKMLLAIDIRRRIRSVFFFTYFKYFSRQTAIRFLKIQPIFQPQFNHRVHPIE